MQKLGFSLAEKKLKPVSSAAASPVPRHVKKSTKLFFIELIHRKVVR